MGVTPIDGFSAITRATPGVVRAVGRMGRLRSALVTMGETVLLSIDSLRAHKLRSFLTLLGVILAVTTLVTVSYTHLTLPTNREV